MDEQPFPLPRATRETEILAGDGGATYGPFDFKIFDLQDLQAFVKHQDGEWQAAAFSAAKVAGNEFDDFTITFAEALPLTSEYIVRSARLHERQLAVTKGGAIGGRPLEKELSKQGSVIAELRRDIWRGGSVLPLEPGRVAIAGEDGRMRPGPMAGDIERAQENAAVAANAAGIAVAAASDAEDAKLAAESAAGANLSNADSVAAARLINIPGSVNYIRTAGYAAPGDGGGALYRRVVFEPAHAGKFQSADGAWWEDPFYADYTVRIPSDFPTLQTAVDALSRQAVRQSARIVLSIESGHKLTHGLKLVDGDYSHFVIISENVPIAITSVTSADPAIVTAPGHGLEDGQSVLILGVIGMSQVNGGIYVVANATTDTFELTSLNGTNIDATGFDSYSGGGAITVPVRLHSAYQGVSNDFAGISDAGITDKNLFVGYASKMPVIGCLVDMNSPRGAERLGHGAYLAMASIVVEPYCGVVRAGITGISSQVSAVIGYRSIWDGSGSEGIRAQQASDATFQWAHANYCQGDPIPTATNAAVYGGRSSSLQFQNGEAKNSYRWAIDTHRAWVNAQEAVLSDATGRCANCQDGAHLILKDADMSGAGEHALRVVAGVWVSANGADMSGAAASSVRIDSGGNIVDLNGVTTNNSPSPGIPAIADILNIAEFNTPTYRGIVFADVDGPLARLNINNAGVFSDAGASNGKRFGNASILNSSRSATSPQAHYQFYNANGLVCRMSTQGTRVLFQPTANSDVWFSGGPGSPEGVHAAAPGSTWCRTDGGGGSTFYVKESGIGATGWVAK